jgi:two-component system, sensor histidine kinase RegB
MAAAALRRPDVADAMRTGLPLGFLQGASLHNLRQLVVMRNIAVVAQAITVFVAYRGLRIDLPIGPMALTIGALALFNVFTWHRLGIRRQASDDELLFQFLVDVAALSLLLALAGGATNPFIGMYVLPLTITAACLPWVYTWAVALITVACYSLLVLYHRPLYAPGTEANYLELLVSGMWINYAITAGMIAYFVVRIATNLRRSQQAHAESREREQDAEHLVRVGTLAAGAAHELAQPLATLSVIVGELEHSRRDDAELQSMVRDMSQQLRNCQETLGALLGYGRDTIDTGFKLEAADAFVRQRLEVFKARYPRVETRLVVCSPGPVPLLRHDLALRQAVLNLLGNAADVTREPIDVTLQWDDETLTLSIRDRGPGLPPQMRGHVGKLFFTTKGAGKGNGLGLSLAHLAVTRLGGMLRLSNAEGGGAVAQVTLPVASSS